MIADTPRAPTALVILDGWGINRQEGGNAVKGARTPFVNSLFTTYPATELICYGEEVGLPAGQMGNSEVGHLNIGAGRVVHQDISRINLALRNGEFFQNSVLTRAMAKVREGSRKLHLLGLVSDGGVHSSLEHLFALIKMADGQKVGSLRVHAFLDGRDAPPDSGAGYIDELQAYLLDYPQSKVASVGGRYWGMDRDKRWKRVEKAYAAMVRAQGPWVCDAAQYVRECYGRGEFDEFVTPAVITGDDGEPLGKIEDGDAVIFFNFRADRARELTWVFNQRGFDGFPVADSPRLAEYVCMTQYDEGLEVAVAFPPKKMEATLAEVISRLGMRQLHIAETEKYAHVTFFFNGGEEEPFPGEDRALIPSPQDVATYDEKPAMSAYEVTQEVVTRINSGVYDLIVMNYANGDMVGHTGVYEAARQAMEDLDQCLARVVPAVLELGGRVILTSDHGNAEQMIDPQTGGPYTAHTTNNKVPFLLVDPSKKNLSLFPGALCDVAPTILGLMEIPCPPQMTGRPLWREPE